jgi:hypothetical protein
LTGLVRHQLDTVAAAASRSLSPARGRRWSLPLPERLRLAMVALRTNLTVRQLAAVFAISTSQVHRIIDRHTRLLATRFATSVDLDLRWSWTLDGTLIPPAIARGHPDGTFRPQTALTRGQMGSLLANSLLE